MTGPRRKRNVSQHWLIDKMMELEEDGSYFQPGNIAEYKTGLCLGVSCMALQAFMTNNMEDFDRRLDLIDSMPIKDFKHSIKEIFLNKESANLDNNDEILKLEIQAFFDGVKLYQKAQLLPHLFTENISSQMEGIAHVASLILPHSLKKPGESHPLKTFSSLYTKNNLHIYLETLQKTVAQITHPAAFLLVSHNHVIMLGFDPRRKLWALIDANHLPSIYLPENRIDLLVSLIFSSFVSKEEVTFSTQAYINQKDETFFIEWQNNPDWKEIHNPQSKTLDSKDKSPWLFIAAAQNQIDMVESLLKLDLNKDAYFGNGSTPILVAAKYGYLGVVEKLLEAKANPNLVHEKNHNSALFNAASKGNIKMVALLLNWDADPNILNSSGDSPLMAALENDDLAIMKILLDSGKVNPNLKGGSGDIPLFFAIENQYTGAVKILLDNGADPDLRNDDGDTALLLAVQNNSIETVQLLLNNHCDVNLPRLNSGVTPLFLAVENENVDIVKLLLENKANPNLTLDEDNKAPLFIAVYKENLEIVEALLNHHADPNHIFKNGITPLFYAAQNGMMSMVKALLKCSETSHAIPYKTTAENLREFAKKYNVVNLMDIFLKQNNDNTNQASIKPAEIADIMGHGEIAKIIRAHVKPSAYSRIFDNSNNNHKRKHETDAASLPSPKKHR